MRTHGKSLALATLATFVVASAAMAQDYVPGQVIVKYSSNKAAGEAAAAAIGATAIETLDSIGAVVLSVGDVDGAVSALSASGGVEYAEPNYLLHASAIPNDPLYGSLYGMDKIDAPLAWDVTTGDPSIIVAVIDTGIDYNHPDLAANVWTNPGEIAGNGIDD
ncbi:MAG: hypothetical protein KC466_07410, partial [Myxococcales bacterium]|nr:hypothetical protein [Myxococcales bacterium]